MDIGLALPQYDFSAPGRMLGWEQVVAAATEAERLGFSSVWLSDHLHLDLARYGGEPGRYPGIDPLVGLAALATATSRVRLGTLTLCVPLRPATVLAKQLASLDVACGGRLVVGLGAGWNEGEFAEAGVEFRAPGQRLAQVGEAVAVLRGMFGGGPFTFDGTYEQASEARCLPRPVQHPSPPLWIGGKGDRLVRLAARVADGWNTVWTWAPSAYRERLAVHDRACERAGRDPGSVTRSVGLYALVGEDEADLARRYELFRSTAPEGVAPSMALAEWRRGHLVGTREEIDEQLAGWADLGVAEVILSTGPPPFGPVLPGDLEMLAKACRLI